MNKIGENIKKNSELIFASVEKSLEALKLFNKKAERLRKSAFTKYINKKLNCLSIEYTKEEGLSIKRRGPDEGDI